MKRCWERGSCLLLGMVSEPMDEHVSYENFFPQMVKFTKDFLAQALNFPLVHRQIHIFQEGTYGYICSINGGTPESSIFGWDFPL